MKWLTYLFILFPLFGCQGDQTSKDEVISTSDHSTPYSNHYEPLKNVQQDDVKEHIMLNVPLIRQNPELKYGCEVTSTAMMLNYSGASVTKMELFEKIKKDKDPLIKQGNDIVSWGDPAVGFVGDMTGKTAGYASFDKPIEALVSEETNGKAVNLTNKPFSSILSHLGKGYPIVVWTTGDYRPPDRWESWSHEGKTIKTPLDLHAVVLVGYDKNNVYLNDPLSGKKQVKVDTTRFIKSWEALEKRAVSYAK